MNALGKEIYEQEIQGLSGADFDEIDLQNLIINYIINVYGNEIEETILKLYENESEIMSKNGEIAKEVFDTWDGCCTDEDFYKNCMETICDIIGHKSGPIPDQAYDIWNIIDKIYL